MPQERLSIDEFFTRLAALLSAASTAQKTSVFLTQKPLPEPDSSSLLIRATDGSGDKKSKVKIATVVAPADLEAFFVRYADVCKAGMGSLKKRDRKRRKAKAKKGGGTGAGQAGTAS